MQGAHVLIIQWATASQLRRLKMAEAKKIMPAKPDIQITLTWDEAVELRQALYESSYSFEAYHALCEVTREV
jgi:hypothetical protein